MSKSILLHFGAHFNTMVTTVYPYGEDFPILKIETSLCTAEISLYGGHVLSWAPTGHKPVIYMSPRAVFKKGKALRGGIPLCWPWFYLADRALRGRRGWPRESAAGAAAGE